MKGNAIAAIIIGIFLAVIVVNGKLNELTAFTARQNDFVRWILAWALVAGLKQIKPISKIVDSIDELLYIVMAISIVRNDPKSLARIREQFDKVFSIKRVYTT